MHGVMSITIKNAAYAKSKRRYHCEKLCKAKAS